MTDCLLHICTDQQFNDTKYYTISQSNPNHSYETKTKLHITYLTLEIMELAYLALKLEFLSICPQVEFLLLI